MRVTLKTIAAEAKVSFGAVSQVLRNPEHPEFSEETRRRILSVARELDYRPSRVAQGLRMGKTRSLAIIVPWNNPELVDTAEIEARKFGYGAMIQFTSNTRDLSSRSEEEAIALAMQQQVDGIVWQPAHELQDYSRAFDLIRRGNAKVVFMGSEIPGIQNADLVTADFEQSMLEALDLMRQRGCKRFALLIQDNLHPLRKRRLAVFNHFLQENHLPGEVFQTRRNPDMPEVRKMLSRIASGRYEKLGMFVNSDWCALDLLQEVKEIGVQIPDQLAIVVFGDFMVGGRHRVMAIANPEMSAVRMPSADIAREAIRFLMDRMEGRVTGPRRELIVKSHLIERKSV